MELASRLDDYGKPAWIVATVAGFWFYWPIGLAVLLFLAWSGRMRAWRSEARGRWHGDASPDGQGTSRWNGAWAGGGCGGRRSRSRMAASGNKAFDDYRSETLRRLEDEQKEFVDYLERLRQARDKAEFDQFMAERRNGGTTIVNPQPPTPAN